MMDLKKRGRIRFIGLALFVLWASQSVADQMDDAFDELDMATGGCSSELAEQQEKLSDASVLIQQQDAEIKRLTQQLKAQPDKRQIEQWRVQLESLHAVNQRLGVENEQLKLQNRQLASKNPQSHNTSADSQSMISHLPESSTSAIGQSFTVDGILFTLSACVNQKETQKFQWVVCTIDAVSPEEDTTVWVNLSNTVGFSNTGQEMKSEYVSIGPGERVSTNPAQQNMIMGVLMPIKIYLKDTTAEATSVSKLEFLVSGQGSYEKIVLRHIPISTL